MDKFSEFLLTEIYPDTLGLWEIAATGGNGVYGAGLRAVTPARSWGTAIGQGVWGHDQKLRPQADSFLLHKYVIFVFSWRVL